MCVKPSNFCIIQCTTHPTRTTINVAQPKSINHNISLQKPTHQTPWMKRQNKNQFKVSRKTELPVLLKF